MKQLKFSKLSDDNAELLSRLQYSNMNVSSPEEYNLALYHILMALQPKDHENDEHQVENTTTYTEFKNVIRFNNGVIAVRRTVEAKYLEKYLQPIVGNTRGENRVKYKGYIKDILEEWSNYPTDIRCNYCMNIRTSDIRANGTADVCDQIKECRSEWVFISFDGTNSGDINEGFLTMVSYAIEKKYSIQLQNRVDRITRNVRDIWVIKNAMWNMVLFAQLQGTELLPVIGTKKFVMNLLIVVAEMDYNKISKKANASWTKFDGDWRELDIDQKRHYIGWALEKGFEIESADMYDFLDRTWRGFHAAQG